MTQVVSFESYQPPARFDAIPWNGARVQEGETSTGPWTQIDQLTLTPLDDDPSNPVSRNLTTQLGTADRLWYRLVWIDGSGNQSAPTQPVQNIDDTNLYVTYEEFVSAASLNGQRYADHEINAAIAAASSGIDGACNRRFWRSAEDEPRYYSALDGSTIVTHDMVSLTELAIDRDQTGVFTEIWEENTDYILEPLNAASNGEPFTRVYRARWAFQAFPQWRRGVRLTGIFGWPAVPPEIVDATMIVANKLVKRKREAPFGVVTAGMDVGVAVQIARTDPDVNFLLNNFIREDPSS